MLTLANSPVEFRAQRAPREHSDLRLLERALVAAGAAETETEAEQTLAVAFDAVHHYAPAGSALMLAGLDRAEIFRHFRALQECSRVQREEEEREQWRRAL